ncbi:MAG: LPS export ABC transporter periplasmic protein LptC [Ostreibacterium sp.]
MKNIVVILLLAFLVVGSFFFLRGLEQKFIDTETATSKQKIGQAFTVVARYYNHDNQLQYHLVSPQVTEFSGDYGTDFIKPQFESYNDTRLLVWQGQSDKAYLTSNKKLLTLTEHVDIVTSPLSEKPMRLKGAVMRYNAETQYITSDKPVVIDDSVVHQTANFLQFNTATQMIDAQNQVRANYRSLSTKKSSQNATTKTQK